MELSAQGAQGAARGLGVAARTRLRLLLLQLLPVLERPAARGHPRARPLGSHVPGRESDPPTRSWGGGQKAGQRGLPLPPRGSSRTQVPQAACGGTWQLRVWEGSCSLEGGSARPRGGQRVDRPGSVSCGPWRPPSRQLRPSFRCLPEAGREAGSGPARAPPARPIGTSRPPDAPACVPRPPPPRS